MTDPQIDPVLRSDRPACPVTRGDRNGNGAASPPQPGQRTPEDWLEVVRGVRAGDPAAMTRLSGLITGLLHRQGAYRVRDSWEDISQDVLLHLVRRVEDGSLRVPRAFVSYAQTLTRTRFLDFIQRRQRVTSGGRRDERYVRASLEECDLDVAPDHAHPDVLFDLSRSLGHLPPRTRCVIEEIYLRGRTYQEAADLLHLPLGTVKRLQTAGLRALREHLGVGEPVSSAEHATAA